MPPVCPSARWCLQAPREQAPLLWEAAPRQAGAGALLSGEGLWLRPGGSHRAPRPGGNRAGGRAQLFPERGRAATIVTLWGR